MTNYLLWSIIYLESEVNIMATKAYKFRLYPTKEQEIMFIKTFGCIRFIYNSKNTSPTSKQM